MHSSLQSILHVATVFILTVVNCGFLANPDNGEVQLDLTTFGSVASYTCTGGCEPVGDNTRTCTADGTWSGSSPQCPGSYIAL